MALACNVALVEVGVAADMLAAHNIVVAEHILLVVAGALCLGHSSKFGLWPAWWRLLGVGGSLTPLP